MSILRKRPYSCLLVDTDTRFLRYLGEDFLKWRDKFTLKLESNFSNVLESLDLLQPDVLVLNWDEVNPDLRDIILRQCHEIVKGVVVLIMLNEDGVPVENPASLGIARTLKKPFSSQGLLRTLLGLFEGSSDGDLAEGYLKSFSLSSFLQVLHVERKTCEIEVISEENTGTLWLKSGEVAHAVSPGKTGYDAAMEIMMADIADINLLPNNYKSEATISQSLPAMLLEAMKIKDELNA